MSYGLATFIMGVTTLPQTMSGKLTYKESGVDTREAAALVGDIGTHVRRTQQQRKLHGAFGLFAAAFDLSEYKQPVIVTGYVPRLHRHSSLGQADDH